MDVLFRKLRNNYPHKEEESKTRNTFSGGQSSESWRRRQRSKQMNSEYESNSEGDYQTAIAAATFAVKSFEDQTRKRDQRIHHQGPEDSSTTSITQPHYTTQPRTRSSTFSDDVPKPTFDGHDEFAQPSAKTREKPREKTPAAFVPSLKKKLSFGETTVLSQPEQALPAEEHIAKIPSLKKPTTLKTEFNRRLETSEPKMDTPPRKQPPPLTTDSGTNISENHGAGDTDADEWEKLEMSRVKEKYERLSATILGWESKKKEKAKSQLDKVQVEPGKRKAKAMQHYGDELERIQKIADRARSQAIANQRNEELKVREKANKLRLTGQPPATCLCC